MLFLLFILKQKIESVPNSKQNHHLYIHFQEQLYINNTNRNKNIKKKEGGACNYLYYIT